MDSVLKTDVTIETYCSTSGAIDRHNKQHQYDIEIERKLRTKDWWKLLNISIFGVIIFDDINVHQACAFPEDIEDDMNEWFTYLSHEMIDNAVKEQRIIPPNTGLPRKVEANPNILPSNKRRRVSTSNFLKQGRCCICDFDQKNTDLCYICNDKICKAVFCCPPRSSRNFFEIHYQECH